MQSLESLFGHANPVALVTGSGAPRVGQMIAQDLAAWGFHLVLHANHSIDAAEAFAGELRQSGTEVLIVQGPVEAEASAARWMEQVLDRFGRLDVAVNSAAIWAPRKLEEVVAAEVLRYLEINTLGSFLVAQAAGLQMIQQDRGGVIINLADWATVRPYINHAAYFPSKGAVEAMTRSLAVEFGHRHPRVRVNAIQPGPVLLDDAMRPEIRAAVEASTLVKRVGTPEHVAHAVRFLIENDFVTGVCLPVDGGRTIYADDGLQTRYGTG